MTIQLTSGAVQDEIKRNGVAALTISDAAVALDRPVEAPSALFTTLSTATNADIDAELALRAKTLVSASTRDVSLASGTVAYTGFGGRPKKLTIKAVASGGVQWSEGISGDNNGVITNGCIYQTNAQVMGAGASYSIGFFDASGNCTGSVASFDADGFTLNWSKAGSPSGTLTLIFFAEF